MTIIIQKENIEITTIEIKNNSIEQFSKKLSEIKKTDYPQAVILKIEENIPFCSTDLAMFIELLTQNEYIIIGIQSKNQEIINYANISGIVVFPSFSKKEKKPPTKDKKTLAIKTVPALTNNENKPLTQKNTVKKEDKKPLSQVKNKNKPLIDKGFNNQLSPLIIDSEIKENEQIYSQDRDLIIGNKVCANTEIISEANVFVYDLMQGKVFAGIKGNKKAVIFIHNFEATLVSIAGIYKKFETIPATLKNKSVNISLSGDKLNFKTN